MKDVQKSSIFFFFPNFLVFFLDETEFFVRDRLARQSHETRQDRDGLVSSRLSFFRDETISLRALRGGGSSQEVTVTD